MAENISRIHTRVSVSTKTRWENFLLSQHSTVKGSYGPELDRAMNHYMDAFSCDSNVCVKTKIHKRRLDAMKLVSKRFRDLPTYPLVTPIIMDSVIKNCMPQVTRRTFLCYRQIILDHKELCYLDNNNNNKDDNDDDYETLMPKFNISKFCEYVDRLTNKSFLK